MKMYVPVPKIENWSELEGKQGVVHDSLRPMRLRSQTDTSREERSQQIGISVYEGKKLVLLNLQKRVDEAVRVQRTTYWGRAFVRQRRNENRSVV
jgi:hypothetical protein